MYSYIWDSLYDCNKIDFIILFGIKQLIIIMEEDILNYSPTVMFRGTPCSIHINRKVSIFDSDRTKINLIPNKSIRCYILFDRRVKNNLKKNKG